MDDWLLIKVISIQITQVGDNNACVCVHYTNEQENDLCCEWTMVKDIIREELTGSVRDSRGPRWSWSEGSAADLSAPACPPVHLSHDQVRARAPSESSPPGCRHGDQQLLRRNEESKITIIYSVCHHSCDLSTSKCIFILDAGHATLFLQF